MKRRKSSRTKKRIHLKKTSPTKRGRILFLVGCLLLVLWGTHKTLHLRSLRISNELLSTYIYTPSYTTQISRIQIGDTINTPVVKSGYVNGDWIVSPDKANHVFQSALPGTRGNIIIYAHNTHTLFGPLKNIQRGETVFLTTSDGVHHTYIVVKIIEVNPVDISPLRPTSIETLTLYTCSGIFDSKRFVVRAIPKALTP